MSDVGARIAEARKRRRLTQKGLAKALGVSQSYISYIEKGSRRLEVGLLQRIAKTLNVAAPYLLTGVEPAKENAAGEARIPVLGHVAAGIFNFLEDGHVPQGISATDEYVADSTVGDEGAFGAIVHGDSMSPRFNDGDRVIFSPAEPVRDGDYVLAKIDCERGTFKQLFYEDDSTVRLMPVNSKYAPMQANRAELQACYKLVRRIERLP